MLNLQHAGRKLPWSRQLGPWTTILGDGSGTVTAMETKTVLDRYMHPQFPIVRTIDIVPFFCLVLSVCFVSKRIRHAPLSCEVHGHCPPNTHLHPFNVQSLPLLSLRNTTLLFHLYDS